MRWGRLGFAGGAPPTLVGYAQRAGVDRCWGKVLSHRQETQSSDIATWVNAYNASQHKFQCAGTLDEKIDQRIERKKEVAERVVGTGEDRLTELPTADLKELFALRKDAVAR